MKKIFIISSLIFSLFLFSDCKKKVPDLDFKQEMRNFVQELSKYAKTIDVDFIIIPQNGEQLASENGEENGSPAITYLEAIDGQGREDLFYGYEKDDEATPGDEINYMTAFLDVEENNDVEVLVTDYCYTHSKMDDSYAKNNARSYISFSASERELNVIPSYPSVPNNVNSNDILNLSDAQNFLYLINPENFSSKQSFISTVSATNYDLIIMDLFFNDVAFTSSEIELLKTKENGGTRLVVSYISVGEAEDYRYYWDDSWGKKEPDWLDKENPDWAGNYKVWYWEQEWKNIIFGNNASYLKKILDAGFDGAYLDIIDAFEYYE